MTTTFATDAAELIVICHEALTKFAASDEIQSVYRYLEDGDLIVLPAGQGDLGYLCEVLATEGFTGDTPPEYITPGDTPPEDLTAGDIDWIAVLMAEMLAEELAKWEV